jgi:transposase
MLHRRWCFYSSKKGGNEIGKTKQGSKGTHLIGDKAYDSDPLDERLAIEYGVELISPYRFNRQRSRTQDGRPLRRYNHRWKVERLFAWLQNFRRILVRYEYHAENYLDLVQLGCTMILLRRCL